MSQTKTKPKARTRVTKKDLEERDRQIDALREEIAQRQEEIDARIASTQALEQANQELVSIARQAADEGLRAALDASDIARWGGEVSEELGLLTEGLFKRLAFATYTLGSIFAYRGENPDVPGQIAQGALDDLAPFVREATVRGTFDAGNLVNEIWEEVLRRDGVDSATIGQDQTSVPSPDPAEVQMFEFDPETEAEFLKTISSLFKEDPYSADPATNLGVSEPNEESVSDE
jgi:hypothetical protein